MNVELGIERNEHRARSYTRRKVRLPRDRKSCWIAGVTAVGALLVVLVFIMSFQSRMQRDFDRQLSRDGIAARLREALTANAERPIPPEVLDRLLQTIRLYDGKAAISREELEEKLKVGLAENSRHFTPEALEHVLRFATPEGMQEAMIRMKDAPLTQVKTKVTRIPR
jgi:hypothetical protein